MAPTKVTVHFPEHPDIGKPQNMPGKTTAADLVSKIVRKHARKLPSTAEEDYVIVASSGPNDDYHLRFDERLADVRALRPRATFFFRQRFMKGNSVRLGSSSNADVTPWPGATSSDVTGGGGGATHLAQEPQQGKGKGKGQLGRAQSSPAVKRRPDMHGDLHRGQSTPQMAQAGEDDGGGAVRRVPTKQRVRPAVSPKAAPEGSYPVVDFAGAKAPPEASREETGGGGGGGAAASSGGVSAPSNPQRQKQQQQQQELARAAQSAASKPKPNPQPKAQPIAVEVEKPRELVLLPPSLDGAHSDAHYRDALGAAVMVVGLLFDDTAAGNGTASGNKGALKPRPVIPALPPTCLDDVDVDFLLEHSVVDAVEHDRRQFQAELAQWRREADEYRQQSAADKEERRRAKQEQQEKEAKEARELHDAQRQAQQQIQRKAQQQQAAAKALEAQQQKQQQQAQARANVNAHAKVNAASGAASPPLYDADRVKKTPGAREAYQRLRPRVDNGDFLMCAIDVLGPQKDDDRLIKFANAMNELSNHYPLRWCKAALVRSERDPYGGAKDIARLIRDDQWPEEMVMEALGRYCQTPQTAGAFLRGCVKIIKLGFPGDHRMRDALRKHRNDVPSTIEWLTANGGFNMAADSGGGVRR